ncbi:thioredoxin-disulfide reductase [Hippea jasoniae]|uniref:thioredoxin-disulfide reductase n=1 Tax=Hippea jasoniae TaxID=944479 RepID=UPI000552E619|nr:thioredoxin-disulfide reductase [Hippea jasoniae]
MYDVIIIGGGPAGLTAGIYAARGGLKTLICEEKVYGGQIVMSYEVENYPGFPKGISGMDLMDSFIKQAEKFGVEMNYDGVKSIEDEGKTKNVILSSGTKLSTKTIIIAAGASPNRLNCPGEKKFTGKGVSYCATCDGAFFRGKPVAVVGGGDSAIEEALYLANLASKVYIIHRRDQLRAVKILQDRAFANKKIEIIFNHVVKEIQGDKFVNGVLIENTQTHKLSRLEVDGVFIYVGLTPNTELVSDIIKLDEEGYIITNERMETNVAGIFAAGDIRVTPLRQVLTAAADGAIAASCAQKYIEMQC